MIPQFKSMSVWVLASVSLFCVGSVSLQAQDKRIVNARTICFERVANGPDIYIAGPKDPKKILMPVESFSLRFKCTLTNGTALFYKEEGMKDDGTPKRHVVAKTKVSSSMSRVLFYFVPAKKGSEMLYDVMALEDGLQRFPLGHSRLLNLSGTEVAFQLGEHVKRIKSGKLAHVTEVKKRDNFNMAPVVCKMMTQDGKWRTISESRTRFTNRKRLLVVSYINPTTRQPQLKVYKDIPPEPAPQFPTE